MTIDLSWTMELSLQLKQRVLNKELVRERSIDRHFGPVVQDTTRVERLVHFLGFSSDYLDSLVNQPSHQRDKNQQRHDAGVGCTTCNYISISIITFKTEI